MRARAWLAGALGCAMLAEAGCAARGASGGAAQEPRKTHEGAMDHCDRTVTPADAAGLQDLLDGLAVGARVCLKPGRYPGRLILRRSVTLHGMGAPADVVLDGEGHGPVLHVDEPEIDVKIDRLTVTGGRPKGGGGGIRCTKNATLLLREVVLRGNQAPNHGGGAIQASLGKIVLERCRIEENAAPIGAGILLSEWARIELRDCLMSGNAGERGSGIAIHGGAQALIERSTVRSDEGVAIEVLGDHERAPTVTVRDSIVAAPATALVNDAGSLGRITIATSVIHGATGLVDGTGDQTVRPGASYSDEGSNRRADPLLDAAGRPQPNSPALLLAADPPVGAVDLSGRPRGATAGALEP